MPLLNDMTMEILRNTCHFLLWNEPLWKQDKLGTYLELQFQSWSRLSQWDFPCICGWRQSKQRRKLRPIVVMIFQKGRVGLREHSHTSCLTVVLYHGPWTFLPDTITLTSTTSAEWLSDFVRLIDDTSRWLIRVLYPVKPSVVKTPKNATRSTISWDIFMMLIRVFHGEVVSVFPSDGHVTGDYEIERAWEQCQSIYCWCHHAGCIMKHVS